MRIEYLENLQLKIEDRGLSMITDQPKAEGGDDEALTPVEMLVASLGACVGVMIAFHSKAKNIDITGMTLDVNYEKVQNPYRVGKIDVKVNYPGETDDRLKRVLERVAHTCAVHNTLTHPPEISINFPWSK